MLARIVSVFGPADRWADDPAQVHLHAAQNDRRREFTFRNDLGNNCRPAIQSPKKTRFLSASQTDLKQYP
jgi:hypothetical protein